MYARVTDILLMTTTFHNSYYTFYSSAVFATTRNETNTWGRKVEKREIPTCHLAEVLSLLCTPSRLVYFLDTCAVRLQVPAAQRAPHFLSSLSQEINDHPHCLQQEDDCTQQPSGRTHPLQHSTILYSSPNYFTHVCRVEPYWSSPQWLQKFGHINRVTILKGFFT